MLGVLFSSIPLRAFGQSPLSAPSPTVNADRLPITTTSPEAAALFAQGLHLRYDFHTEEALAKWREATTKDPDFAQAWAYIVWLGLDPGEVKRATEKAQRASQNVTAGEKLLVKWMTSTNEGYFLGAIAAMND